LRGAPSRRAVPPTTTSNSCSGARALISPLPYGPDFDPIATAFGKLKALLRKAAESTVDGLWAAVGRIGAAFTPAECANHFSACG
jgi:hypothetical protein